MITSARNPRIQWVRALQTNSRIRREETAFVVEGVRLVEEALATGWQARLVLHTEDLSERGMAIVQGFAALGAPVEMVTPPVLHAASDTETPQGLLAVLDWRPLPLPEKPDFVFIPDGVRDPGNLGTMLRTAAAAGVQAVLLPPETADAFAPKVLRAGMGAHFRLPVQSVEWAALESYLRPLQVFLAEAGEGVPYFQAGFCAPLALVVGGETAGASQSMRALAARHVHIPMPGGSESLNAAIAAGILMFEIARQRATS